MGLFLCQHREAFLDVRRHSSTHMPFHLFSSITALLLFSGPNDAPSFLSLAGTIPTTTPLIPDSLSWSHLVNHHPDNSDCLSWSLSYALIPSKALDLLLQMRFSDPLELSQHSWVYPHSVVYPLKMPVSPSTHS